MSFLDAARYRLGTLRRALFDRAAYRRELDAELDFHADLDALQRRETGDSPDDARRAARRRLGRPARARERVVDATGASAVDALGQDLRFAARALRKSPGFSLVAALTLALGIGATTAVFSVVDAALLRPLPYAGPQRLVFVADQQDVETPVAYPEFLDWRAETRVFSDVAAYFTTTLALAGAGEPEVLNGARVSASLARVLGVSPSLGRAFRDEEDAPGAERVILLGDGLWRRRFGGDPGVVGRTLTLHGRPYVVVGVLPPGPRGALPDGLASARRVDFWVPLRLDAESAPRGLHFLTAVGRLAPGVDVTRARAHLDVVAERYRREDPTRHGVSLGSLRDRVVGDARQLLSLLLGAVTLVLLVGCTNVANLLLARGAVRRREIAIRNALGAGRGRVTRLLVTESLVLAAAGGALGVLLAYGGLAALRTVAATTLPRVAEAGVDGRILAFALAVSVATGLVFGLAPALRLSRPGGPGQVLRDGGRGTAGVATRDRLRGALVVAEVALSFVLLIGAGLLVRSFGHLLAVEKGFDASRVLTFSIVLPQSRYAEAHQQVAFFTEVLERLRATPGVRGAALVNNLPLAGGANGGVSIEGRAFPPGAEPVAEKRVAGADYFRVLGIPTVRGRTFTAADRPGAPPVALVNESFARRHFPNESAVGRRVGFGWETTGSQEIVGVVGDLRERSLAEPPQPTIYVPFGQRSADPAMFVVVRTESDPKRFVRVAREAVFAVDRNQPIDEVRTLDDVVATGLAGRRLALALLGSFSSLALLLAAVGLYAVVSHGVAQRVQEIGVRVALGAGSGDVVRLVLGQSAALVAGGVIVGAAAALATARVVSGMLFGVGPADPATFAGVAALLGGVALAASAVPAVRASRGDPLAALRRE